MIPDLFEPLVVIIFLRQMFLNKQDFFLLLINGLAFLEQSSQKLNVNLSTEKSWQEFIIDDVLPFTIQDSL
jgi:hypothetical protein